MNRESPLREERKADQGDLPKSPSPPSKSMGTIPEGLLAKDEQLSRRTDISSDSPRSITSETSFSASEEAWTDSSLPHSARCKIRTEVDPMSLKSEPGLFKVIDSNDGAALSLHLQRNALHEAGLPHGATNTMSHLRGAGDHEVQPVDGTSADSSEEAGSFSLQQLMRADLRRADSASESIGERSDVLFHDQAASSGLAADQEANPILGRILSGSVVASDVDALSSSDVRSGHTVPVQVNQNAEEVKSLAEEEEAARNDQESFTVPVLPSESHTQYSQSQDSASQSRSDHQSESETVSLVAGKAFCTEPSSDKSSSPPIEGHTEGTHDLGEKPDLAFVGGSVNCSVDSAARSSDASKDCSIAKHSEGRGPYESEVKVRAKEE